MDEPELLARTLDCIDAQSYRDFTVYVCVNQPDDWWDNPEKAPVCRNNADSLELLSSRVSFPLVIIDHTSRGFGWKGKSHGVGQARKVLMDAISKAGRPEDVIISLDADTTFPEDYFLSVARNFQSHPEAVALSVPYFHKCVPDETVSRAMLRYEIYMRHYYLNLARTGSPYTFTALGSAMAFPLWAYRAIGGMAPKMSGEDFYFLQKLRKFGPILLWNDCMVFPEARFSNRVFFGTGPAMIKGAGGDWTSYPVYPSTLFNDLMETYLLLPVLFLKTLNTKVVKFLAQLSGTRDPLRPLRENHKDSSHFFRAFHEKMDGLRILQYLKTNNHFYTRGDEENLWNFFEKYHPGALEAMKMVKADFSFASASIADLEKIRSFLYEQEMEQRFSSAFQ